MVQGQGSQIFPGLYGQELLDSLVAHYKPQVVLSYDDARDTLFARIDNHNDSLTGVYSGYTIYLNPTADPTTDAYLKGINTEHTWPQSKGADAGNARSDMHHLYPARDAVNSSRSNDPFAEINDSDTDKWWRHDYYLTTIPTQFIDEYSEKDEDANRFEPREDHKGNAARSMFYFYTMYKAEADNADPNFFLIQKEILYQWHKQDPADSAEVSRTYKIAKYQENKPNPFVLDSTLVRRAYFPPPNADPPTHLTFSNVTTTSMTLNWLMPNGYDATLNDICVVMQAGSPVDDDPTPNPVSSYTANSVFGRGSEVGSGSYVVYIGDSTGVTVTGLSPATTYYVSIWNTLHDTTWSTSPLTGSQTTLGSDLTVMISEIMQNPNAVADSDGEWFELYNYGSTDVDINGWTIKDLGSDSHTIDNGGALIIPAGGFLVLGNNANSSTNGGVQVDYQYTGFFLSNADDEIILIAGDGTTEVDRVEYDGGVNWPDPTGASMVFTGTASQNNNDPSLWSIASEPWPGSAGDAGSPGYAGPDQALPVVLSMFRAQVTNQSIILIWRTESEINNLGFEVYRRDAPDGDFVRIADYLTHPQLQGQGNSNRPRVYQFEDVRVIPGQRYAYRIADVSLTGERHFSDTLEVLFRPGTVPIVRQPGVFPTQFRLHPNYPNPFNPQTWIRVDIPLLESGPPPVRLTIYDINGRRVYQLLNAPLPPGRYDLRWDGTSDQGQPLPSGIYFVVFQTPQFYRVQKMTLLR
ncbi:MAG: T9SS type A sorting domain-containing protein [Calditrichaeota bacterium]|nr:T9SS type A sorting domain-containing protein [Calditrichota bacterium]